MKNYVTVYLIFSLCFVSIALSHVSERENHNITIKQGIWRGKTLEYVDGEILLKLKQGVQRSDLINILEDYEAEIIRECNAVRWAKIRIPQDTDVFAVIDKLKNNPLVENAEPNGVWYPHATVPNDPYYVDGHQWPLKNIGQDPPGGSPDADIDAQMGWAYEHGNSKVLLAILDSGISLESGQLSHPDLNDATRIILGPDFVGDNGDGNGVKDEFGHGTHVTGIAAAETDNGVGIAGVNWGSKILVIQVFDSGGHLIYWDDLTEGIEYAVNYAKPGPFPWDPAYRLVMNFSGGGFQPSSSVRDAIAYADSNDCILVASAGNIGWCWVMYPAAYADSFENVIAVSATDPWDNLSPYSSYGPEITVAAPGGYGYPYDGDDVFSTYPTYPTNLDPSGSGYGYCAGTSMAAPHVSGLAALLVSIDTTLTDAQVKQIICETADDLGDPGEDTLFGAGRINVYRAVTSLLASSPPYQSGWPAQTDGSISSSPVIGDLDRDSDLEVVIVSGADVCVYRENGTPFSDSWPQRLPSNTGSSEATLGDIDDDGILEIIVNAPDGVHAWNENGSFVEGWPQYTTNFVNYPAIIADMDGSGNLDEVVAGDDDGVLNVWTGSGDTYYGFPLQYSGSLRGIVAGKVFPYTMFPPYDVNLIIFEQGLQSYIHRWCSGGYWPQSFDGLRVVSPAIGDIDADGNLDVVVVNYGDSIHIWDYNGIDVSHWPNGNDSFMGFPALGDIDDDNDLELVAWANNKVYVYDKEGNVLPNWPQEIDEGDCSSFSYSFAIGDIDGDGSVEIISSGLYKIYAWHSNGMRVERFPIAIPDGVVFSSPAIGDLDNDGDIELIIGSCDGKVYVWDLTGSYNPANIEWQMFQKIQQKTGCYPQVTVAAAPHQYEVPQGGTLDFLVTLTNHTNITQVLTVWVEVNHNGTIIYRSQDVNFNLQHLSSVKHEVHQLVPRVAPLGKYTYTIKVQIPQSQPVVVDRGTFYFKVVTNQNNKKQYSNWEVLWNDQISQGVREDRSQGQVPTVNYLYQNTPNPFGKITEINYQLKRKNNVNLTIYNALGQVVTVLTNISKEPGYYTISWDGRDSKNRRVSEGIYFIKMKTDDFEATRKILLLR
jgi:thermitase